MGTYETRSDKQKFYLSPEWRNLREYQLAKDPFCAICKVNSRFVQATCVHHKVEIEDDAEKALEINNLMSLCKPCHSRITFSKSMKGNIPKNKKSNNQLTLLNRKWKTKD